jgi:hypothetical protein
MSSLPVDFWRGIDLFNGQEFFECHEVLEEVWNHQIEPERTLTQAIIQVAVAHYHAGRGNFVGAEKLLLRAIRRLEQSLGLNVGIDVKSLCADTKNSLVSVQVRKTPTLFTIRRQ